MGALIGWSLVEHSSGRVGFPCCRPRPRYKHLQPIRSSRSNRQQAADVPSTLTEIAERAPRPVERPNELAELTAQEHTILLLVADGMTNRGIAGEVFLADKTVKNYVSSILSKLNLQRRTQAALVAKHHLLPVDEA